MITASEPPSALAQLPTPALVLDRRRLNSNIDRMDARVAALGIRLRPHMKTPKSIHVFEELAKGRAMGVAVSTMAEARYFFDQGVKDIFYAVPPASDKVSAIAELQRRGADMKVLVDSRQTAEALVDAARDAKTRLSVIVEIDVDNYRSGTSVDDPDFLNECALLNESEFADFRGVMTYGGASYGCESTAGMAEVAEGHRKEASRAAFALEQAGIGCGIVSFGSTPATMFAESLQGFTETRCGIYLFQDLFQAGIGACERDDIALSVLTTVIGHQPRLNRFIIDAGGLALSKDRSTQGRSFDAGFGLICDRAGSLVPDLHVKTVSQELGLVTTQSGAALDLSCYPVGTKLRVLPNHADMTAAAYETYHVVDGGDRIEARWTRVNGW